MQHATQRRQLFIDVIESPLNVIGIGDIAWQHDNLRAARTHPLDCWNSFVADRFASPAQNQCAGTGFGHPIRHPQPEPAQSASQPVRAIGSELILALVSSSHFGGWSGVVDDHLADVLGLLHKPESGSCFGRLKPFGFVPAIYLRIELLNHFTQTLAHSRGLLLKQLIQIDRKEREVIA